MARKSQFSEEQIIRASKEVDAGAKTAEVCRGLGISEPTTPFTHQRVWSEISMSNANSSESV